MINEKENTKISKFISLLLRHKPEIIGLALDENGWVEVDDLIEKMNKNGFKITVDILNHIVTTNSKKRFSFNDSKTKIRASQGHSIEVELHLKETPPPKYLYHGTAEKSVSSILKSGLEKRNRQYVHLSSDPQTARIVGQRHGKATVFMVAAGKMKEDGFPFYLSDNNVWLIENVPVNYLKLLED